MLKIEKLNKYFNKGKKSEIHVINDVNLELGETGLVALLGESGSGKTTLLNTIGGLDKVKSGNIYIDSKKITSKSSYKVDKIRNLNIGYIFQDYKLIDDKTVFENVAITLKLIGIKDKEEIKRRVNYVLEKVGIYRYRNRLAESLSGGERQRVGIARAIVKNPKILLCDEPTGNLDSKNSLEVMNIIKAISKERLVILVTHERNLAEFFASTIIEIADGKILSIKDNTHENNLDYQIDGKIYLKDFENHENFSKDNLNIDVYGSDNKPLNLKIVIKDNNIYINSNIKEIEVVNEQSNIEFIDEHYKAIDKKEIENYSYDFKETFNTDIPTKYSSIFNLFTLVTNGFKKIFKFSKLKKILLVGFFVAGIFAMYSVSSIFATIKVDDIDFVDINKNYLTAKVSNIKVDDYLKYESNANINYILPSDSVISAQLLTSDFLQLRTSNVYLTGSIAGKQLLSQEEIILGNISSDINTFVIDEMVAQRLVDSDDAKMVGITKIDDLLNRKVVIPVLGEFTITGISDTGSPSIYMNNSLFVNILYLCNKKDSNIIDDGFYPTDEVYDDEIGIQNKKEIFDYNLFLNDITLKEGRLPVDDYEVIVNINNRYEMPLNKEIDTKINDKKLKVVGYYESHTVSYKLVNNNMIKYSLIEKAKNIAIYSKDKVNTKEYFSSNNITLQDSYEYSKNLYLANRSDTIKANLTSAGIVLIISLIEIFFMIRSSFLSRIKEVGIYRAIGLKKIDIYKMFSGEIIAITTLANVPAILLTAYVLNTISKVNYFSKYFVINIPIILLVIIGIYIFNLVIGLIPIFTTIIKTPASILSRYDVD